MYQKQPSLSAGYYGPSVPPFEPSYHRSRSNGWCNFCPMYFNLFFKPIIAITTTVIIVLFLFWLIVPHMVKFHVTDATLTQFNYTSNGTLHYDLSLKINVRNRNMLFGIYYRDIEVRALFHNAWFGSKLLAPFYQGYKKTKVLNPVFKGERVLELNKEQISELKKENTSGIYNIDVKMYMKTRFNLGLVNCNRLKPKVRCNLHVPLKGSAGVFKSTKCVLKVL